METRIESLSDKMDKLMDVQATVLSRLQGMSRDMESLRGGREEEGAGGDVTGLCREMSAMVSEVNQRSEQQSSKLEGMERLVVGIQQVIAFIGEAVKSSRLMELVCNRPPAHKGKDVKEKARLTFKGLKPQKKKKPPDADTVSLKKQALLLEEVQKLNQQNAERSGCLVTPEPPVATAASGERGPEEDPGARLAFILDGPRAPVAEAEDSEVEEEPGETAAKEEEEEEARVCSEEQPEEGEEVKADEVPEEEEEEEEAEEEEEEGQETEEIVIEGPTDSEAVGTKELPAAPEDMSSETSPSVQESSEDPEGSGPSEVTAGSSKRRVTEEDLLKEDLKKSRVEEDEEEEQGESAQAEGGEEGGEPEKQAEEEEEVSELSPEEYVIDSTPPPLAPFDHRIVAAKPHTISNFYTINREEILGGGRFGQVHKCVENSSGLTLAAKIIKARSQKEKEVVRNEIQVMNQLDHANLIQLYAAFESRNDIILVMEYVDGGELFDRIIDENYNLTELDTVLFIRQITEGLQYMHQMYILHLDLKPENILCVSRSTNKIKIIDFGLARRYKPREKLRVNFGTPEFLAPEVINYEFVSFPTDMWSLGVITYMLLSGLSPFLGEDDNETLNNILACQWNFEEDEFSNISEEAKDFITRLLVKSKSWRMSATESLKHPWLSDQKLHYRLHQKGNKCHSTHTPPPES
ncbi:myosin light chain kinase 3 [Conger conger]|uniref:myosin light chain kinase 3 n=1 Tax=Conger conger TaxID=82655 RepID=UPI002A5A7A6D|nr:myosin light chain kinase 3 [Conger conger]